LLICLVIEKEVVLIYPINDCNIEPFAVRFLIWFSLGGFPRFAPLKLVKGSFEAL